LVDGHSDSPLDRLEALKIFRILQHANPGLIKTLEQQRDYTAAELRAQLTEYIRVDSTGGRYYVLPEYALPNIIAHSQVAASALMALTIGHRLAAVNDLRRSWEVSEPQAGDVGAPEDADINGGQPPQAKPETPEPQAEN